MLWRCLSISFALTEHIARLRERLAQDPPKADNDPALIWAAVAIVIAPGPDAILLIRRAERTGDPWSGHMALPGGRRAAADADLLDTAVRETEEEVGILLGRGNLLGVTTDVVPRTPVLPPIAVRPYVFLLEGRPSLTLNQEVASASWATLNHLLRPETHHLVQLDVAGQSRVVPAYQVEDGVIWGMTERILSALLGLLRN